jgi:hypothetical protein
MTCSTTWAGLRRSAGRYQRATEVRSSIGLPAARLHRLLRKITCSRAFPGEQAVA